MWLKRDMFSNFLIKPVLFSHLDYLYSTGSEYSSYYGQFLKIIVKIDLY